MGVLAGEALANVYPDLPETAVRAAGGVGNRLHGVDLQRGVDDFAAAEVNDHTTVVEREEAQKALRLSERLMSYVAEDWGEA